MARWPRRAHWLVFASALSVIGLWAAADRSSGTNEKDQSDVPFDHHGPLLPQIVGRKLEGEWEPADRAVPMGFRFWPDRALAWILVGGEIRQFSIVTISAIGGQSAVIATGTAIGPNDSEKLLVSMDWDADWSNVRIEALELSDQEIRHVRYPINLKPKADDSDWEHHWRLLEPRRRVLEFEFE